MRADSPEPRTDIPSHLPDVGNVELHDITPDTWLFALFVAYNEPDGDF